MTLAVRWSWRPLSGFPGAERAQLRLGEVLGSWLGTPYSPGNQVKGPQGGVDCVRFVCAVLDELYGTKRIPIPELPNDVAMHSRDTAFAAMRFLLRAYEPHREVVDGILEPGDVLVVAMPGGGPGHAMIAGPDLNTLWHATGREVQRAGIGFLWAGYSDWKLSAVYRVLDRERWA